MDAVCRTCLTLGDLSPIFSNRKQHTLYTSVLLMTTGLKIELEDGLPQCICVRCTNLVNSALRLRDQSHHAQQILLENGFQKVARSRGSFGDVAEDEEKGTTSEENNVKDESKNKGSDKDSMQKELKVEIDLKTAAALENLLAEERNCENKAVIINCDSKNISETATTEFKVKRKCTKKKVKEKNNDSMDSFNLEQSDNDMDCSESLHLKHEGDNGEMSKNKVKIKRKYPKKNIEHKSEQDNSDTKPKVKRKYVRKSENERLEAKAKKGLRLSRQETVEKYRHMMESEYVPKQPISCRVCKKQFARMSTFIPHVKRHFIGEYVCEQCGRRFHTRHSLSEHGMRLHGAERVLCCQHCDYRAIDQYQLKNHVHKVHTGERPFVCDICGADFYCKSNIRQHMRKHYGTKNVQCDRCPAMFNSRSSLSSHTAKSHRMNFAYFCYLCPRRYTGRCAVRSHLTRQHGVPRHLQGPVAMRKWSKNEPPPPDVAFRITS